MIEQDGSSMNVIDLAPRLQALLPPEIVGRGSTLRLVVKTQAYARTQTRIGLTFKSVEAKPLTLFGNSLNNLLPSLQAQLPQASLFSGDKGQRGLIGEDGPGYFDVLYLDEDCLIIAQNDPGGIFVNIRSTLP